ncbi:MULTISPECIES: roadblock/LC7 domain-containing protein [Streptomyces]|uniref:Regulator of Ras-like GTPase activity (Roadblock/LC7/MglB family) n=2 Tax=Streptomyces TaxID=1883 RepID=A0ABT9L2I2_9ACTN|nr:MULTISPECIES: roadblock/LC7 domain-containing protein [Streptomyces]MBW8091832.1 roadblock/LC7 domain-containing protein [Streptomyces hygroscopicus subsp. hygroscopicus]MCO8302377.1 roadblock/LC7 domain-containing protein [Streptomyces sp. RKCA744]MDN3059128.1 roadblock/LC7 domain-containing protein [Streptomyces sp. SRF1]MDP9614924.1 putative regulator of Ras-like GTPase activity (Roadblock/LC7/MglB family) [Streptomyces demainii]GHJ32805.1 dynein regulation protein LC7 [Streptomyces hygr
MTSPHLREVSQFGWLVTNFTERVPNVAHAVVVSADGLLLTASDRLADDRAEQVATIAAGAISLIQGAAQCLLTGDVRSSVIQMEYGNMLLMSIKDGSCLVVLAAPDCEIGQVAYEMTVLVDQVGEMLTPELRAELQELNLQGLKRTAAN